MTSRPQRLGPSEVIAMHDGILLPGTSQQMSSTYNALTGKKARRIAVKLAVP
jgi:hypothetical protein